MGSLNREPLLPNTHFCAAAMFHEDFMTMNYWLTLGCPVRVNTGGMAMVLSWSFRYNAAVLDDDWRFDWCK